ncbi:hypothetical protein ACV7JQ_09220 [Globicatella sulfidifaciens]
MQITISKYNLDEETYSNVSKVIFHENGETTEYTDRHCIRHTSQPSTITVVTNDYSKTFSDALIVQVRS